MQPQTATTSTAPASRACRAWPVTWARPMTATQRPTAITVAAVISLKEGLRSSMPKNVMTGRRG